MQALFSRGIMSKQNTMQNPPTFKTRHEHKRQLPEQATVAFSLVL
jgi:hypothetical protein